MPPPNRPHQPTGESSLEWILTDDGSRTLFDSRLNETFHSGCGAVAETLIVYLLNSGVLDRLRSGQPRVVVEYGLGTATGFLLTAALAEFYQTQLSYHAFEVCLLPPQLFRQLEIVPAVEKCLYGGFAKPLQGADPGLRIAEFECLPKIVDQFCDSISRQSPAARAPSLRNTHWLKLTEFVELHLLLGDLRNMSQPEFEQIPAETCDAIYFDPYSPETNPELWTANFFQQAHNYLKPGGTLTSYCVKSSVRRELVAGGFLVDKLPGPMGGKREVLRATK